MSQSIKMAGLTAQVVQAMRGGSPGKSAGKPGGNKPLLGAKGGTEVPGAADAMQGMAKKSGYVNRVRAMAKAAMVQAIQTKIASVQRQAFVRHLDKVAAYMPLSKQASVRLIQSAVSGGRNLSYAIKLAYPQLTGEQRGILASDMVRSAYPTFQKMAEGMGIPTVEPKTVTGPAKNAKKLFADAN